MKAGCLREFLFPEYQRERFLEEKMARKYMVVHINKATYIGNYQDDRLTKNRELSNIKFMSRTKNLWGHGLRKI